MDAAVKCTVPDVYKRHRPERSLWYRTVQGYFETWLALSTMLFNSPPSAYVERAFRRFLECGILVFGFARARCDKCGHDFLIAFSCKERGVCPSCNARRMVETAAHLVDHVFPRLPVRQWVLSVPKRLRYFLQRDAALQGVVLRVFLHEVEHCLRKHSSGCGATARMGAVAFIQRFGSSLNEHVHFHCCVIDGVFDLSTANHEAVVFHQACKFDAEDFHHVQETVRRRILDIFVHRKLIEKVDGDEMAAQKHAGGFSVDASIRVEAADRSGLERLLRYCARPPFSLERLQQLNDGHLIYHCTRSRLEAPRPNVPNDLVLTPVELISRIAALIPPPKLHLHRYYGVLAPNAHMRTAVTALAKDAETVSSPEITASHKPSHHAASHYLWYMLLMKLLAIRLSEQTTLAKSLVMARIYEAFPLICPICNAPMRIIAFITDADTTRHGTHRRTNAAILSPARGPPLWEVAMAPDQASNDPQWDFAQPEPDYEFDQRLSW